jgi:hypothetical protein
MVRVELKNGEVFEARFLERTRKKILIFADGRRVKVGDVKAFSDRRLLQPVSRSRKV